MPQPAAMSVSITEWLNTDVTEFARQRLVAAVSEQIARVEREESARSGGIKPLLESMMVDGVRDATLSQITGTSKIILDWNYIIETVIRTVEYLRLHGPEESGNWKRSVVCLIDGSEADPAAPLPKDTEEALIVVTAHYARRLEVGKTESGRAFAVQVPQHLVEDACLKLRSQMRDLAKFDFDYVDLAGAFNLSARAQHRTSFRAGHREYGARRAGETTVRYPCIRISEIKAL